MVKLRKNNALLAILFVLAGVGLLPLDELKAAGALEWQDASESSATADTIAINPFDNKGLLDGLVLATGAAPGAFVEIRDSATANTSRAIAFAPIAVVFFGTNTVTAGQQSQGVIYTFPRPLRIYNGLSVNASNCNTTSMCYSVQFRRVSD